LRQTLAAQTRFRLTATSPKPILRSILGHLRVWVTLHPGLE